MEEFRLKLEQLKARISTMTPEELRNERIKAYKTLIDQDYEELSKVCPNTCEYTFLENAIKDNKDALKHLEEKLN